MKNTQPYLIPLSIIVAGALVAGGIYFGGVSPSGKTATKDQVAVTQPEIKIASVTADDHILGNPDAKIKIVEFSDTQCPFCKQFHTSLHKIIDSYGKDGTVAWVYRHFPIDQLHKNARKEAEASECAADQGGNDAFWKYIDEVYNRTGSNDKLDPAELPKIASSQGLDVTAFNTCLSSGKFSAKINEQIKDANASGGNGTPYSVLILKDKVSKEVVDFVDMANKTFGAKPGQEIVLVSKDMKKVSVSGALPYDFFTDLIDILNK
jgi:protein-disulfide isomerase